MPGAAEFLSGGGDGGTPAPSGGGGSAAEFLKNVGSKSGGSSSSKKKSGFFGINLPKLPLIHVDLPSIGVHTAADNPVTQVKNVVAGAVPGLARLGIGLGKELLPRNPLNAGHLQAPSWQSVKREMPITSAQIESLGQTARQIPDTAVGLAVNKGSLGQRLANTNLGHQVHEQGILSTGLAKVADVTALAGGVGMLGRAAGAGRLAEASRLERLAAETSRAAGLGKVADEAKLAKAAFELAEKDPARAADLARAADQMSQASNLRRFVEQSGGVEQAANNVTAKAATTARLGGKVAAAPFLPTEKGLALAGKGLGLVGKLDRVAPYVERAKAALDKINTKRMVGDLHHEQVQAPFQAEMHSLFQRHGLEDVARNLSPEERAAIYLSKSQEGLTPGVREFLDAIDQVPELDRHEVLSAVFPKGDVTPETFDLARRFDEGTLPEAQQAKMKAASDALTAVQERREKNIYAPGRGTSKPLSEEALANRAARAEGRSAPADIQAAAEERRTPSVEQARANQRPRYTSTLRDKIAQIEEAQAKLRETPAEPVAPSPAQERAIGKHAERVRRRAAELKGEEARGERTMSRASQIIEKNQRAAANREGQVIGRGRERMAESEQLGRPSRGEMQARISRDSRLAVEKSKAENTTANKILGEHAQQQQGFVERAQKRLEAAQRDEAAAREKFARDNQVRADRKQERRLAELDRQKSKALDDIAKAEQEARDSIEAAPPQDRPALQVAYRAKKLALDLADEMPEHADLFKQLADDIADTKGKLEAKGVKTEFFLGGEAPERGTHVPATAKLRQAKKLQSERNRISGSLARDLKTQTEKMAQEILGVLNNEFRGKFQKEFGSTIGDEFGGDHGLSNEELLRAVHDEKYVAWDSKTGKVIDDPAKITASTELLPKDLHEAVTKYTTPKSPNALLKVYDKATGKWKHTVLALSPRWHAGNIIGNAALATLGAGLSPKQIATSIGEARRLIKDFESGKEIPAEHQASLERLLAAGYHNPDLGEVTGSGRVSRLIAKSYEFNETIDSMNRVMVYLAKHKSGVSAEAAVQMALKAAGDFSKMTPFERNVVRRVVPFYAWQRHITRLAFSLPVEAPARVAWTLHLSELENQLNPDPGKDNPFNEGTIPFLGGRLSIRSLDPYGSSFWLDPSFRGAGYALNPVLKLGAAAATGHNLNKGFSGMVSGKYLGKNPSGFGAPDQVMALKNPAALAQFAAGMVPAVETAQDLVAGKVPVRYDTGEPRKVGPGATKKNAKPTLTGRGRKETIARFFGIPVPEPESKATTKKK